MELELKQCVRCKMEKPTFAFHRSSKTLTAFSPTAKTVKRRRLANVGCTPKIV